MLYSLRAHRIKSNPKGSLARPPMSESQRITIQSHLEVAVWVKYVLPVMLLGGTLLIFGKNALTWRFFFVVPSILLAFFFFSLAVIRVSDGTVWYKQFFEWTAIDTNEVVDSGQVWAGVIGYIRLKRFVRPWGKLYIVLDESSSSNPFRKGEHALLHYLGNGLRQHENEGQNPESVGRFSSNYGLLLGASTGVLFYLLGRSLQYLTDRSTPRNLWVSYS